MNRKLLALAVGAALALPLTAQAAPSIYGSLAVSVDVVDDEVGIGPNGFGNETDQWQVNDNASRIGVRGSESLTSSLNAIYGIEWGVAVDGDGGDLLARNRFLGLQGSWGTFRAGKYDSPLKLAEGYVDVFDDRAYADMGNFITGQNRMNDYLGYVSPKIADAIILSLAIQPGESNAEDGPAEGVSASVSFEQSGLYLALAADSSVADGNFQGGSGAFPADARDSVRLVGAFTTGDLQIGGLIQSSESANAQPTALPLPPTPVWSDVDEMAFMVSGALKMGKNTFKGQLGINQLDFNTTAGSADGDLQFLSLGADHNFTASTKAFAGLTWANLDVDGGDDVDTTVLSLGMETRF